MGIYGIGTDIVRIARIERALARHGERFSARILGAEELRKYRGRQARSPQRGLRFLATRFAAKEAFSKAIGLGMRMPMTWRAMQTLNLASGKPLVQVSGALQQFMQQRGLHATVSVSDEADFAVAFVIVENE